jgi:hypothetical protein
MILTYKILLKDCIIFLHSETEFLLELGTLLYFINISNIFFSYLLVAKKKSLNVAVKCGDIKKNNSTFG